MCAKSWDTSYQELLQLFSLPDLQQRRLYLDLCTMLNGLFYFPNDVFVHQTSSVTTRSSTSQTFICPFARTCSYFNSFVPCTIHSWNFLPTSVTSINSIASFKLKSPGTYISAFAILCPLHICKNFYKKFLKSSQVPFFFTGHPGLLCD